MPPILEVPGEANPLSRQTILNALLAASSNTQVQVQAGTQQLQNWEKEDDYYIFLQDVFTDYSVPEQARYLSVIQLKNGVDKYWRKTSPNALKPDVKQRIKSRALDAGLVEPAPLLALHNALMIAKILRYEFPTEWPDAITKITQLLHSSVEPGANSIQLSRSLLILLQVVKELSTGKVLRIRKGFQLLAPELFRTLANIYVQRVERVSRLLNGDTTDGAGALEAVEQTLIALKIIRRLIISGYENPNRNTDVQQFWALTLTHFANFVNISKQQPANLDTHFTALIGKHAIQLSKLHLAMAKDHPAGFALLPQSIDMVKFYWDLVTELGKSCGSSDLSQLRIETGGDADSEEKTLLEKLGLKGLLLLRACAKLAFHPVQTFKYQHPEDKEERNSAVQLIKSQLFVEGFAVQVMELLVTRFFVFRAGDLREWEEEPEEWEKREEEITHAWEFSIRSCAEKLFLDLIVHFKDSLVPKLLNVFYSYATPQNHDILLKDSLYSAIGLAAACLEKTLDFNAFLISTLIPEVQIQQPGYYILRRRTAILLGQWVPVKPSELDRDSIYRIFQHLLNKDDPTNDQVVRITAGRQLKAVLDPYEFTAEGFLPFAPPILQSLMNLIQEVSLPETKMALLETVRVAVVKLEDHISPYADQIVTLLPSLWDQSGEEHLMKQAILTLLSSIIHSMKQESVRYHPLVLPLIQKSIEPGSESLVYLLEESLDLWYAVLAQTPSPAGSQILSLFPSLFPVFEIGTESVRQALEITESYILLAPREFLDGQVRFRLLTALESFLGPNVRPRIGLVPYLASALIRIGETSPEAKEQTYTLIAESFVSSSFLRTLLAGLNDAHEASFSTGPNKKYSPIDGVAETDHFSVLARLALANPGVFMSAVRAATYPVPEEQTLKWILEEWFFHFDGIGDIATKKLHTLALTHLLSINGPSSPPPAYLLNNLQSYLSIWTDVITELADDGDNMGGQAGDYLVNFNSSSTYNPEGKYQENEPPETTRRRVWTLADPIHQINIRDYVTEHLRALVEVCGGIDRFREEWLVNVDKEVVNEFAKLGVF
uniref:KapH n=1 Tax=Coccidioides posadasii RMSCC 3488 TaxID=454284 RepID=A0A0J6FIE8_COCPO|nr:KapH [Coccidioides posadasii RMSCC 3488]